MDTYTLALRQKEAISSPANGQWESVIQEKIEIEEGDSVVMKSVFIDTEASSNQKVNVPEDLTLNFQWINWIDWNFGTGQFISAAQQLDPISGQPGQNYINASGQRYAIMNVVAADSADINYITRLQFSPTDIKPGGKTQAFDLTLIYTDINGNAVNEKVSVPSYPTGILPGIINKTVYYLRADGLKFEPSNLSPYGVVLDVKQIENTANEIVGQPILQSYSMTLEQGAYSPVDLCNAINKKLTQQVSASGNLYGNKFLQFGPNGAEWAVCIDDGELQRGPAANVFKPLTNAPHGVTSGRKLLFGTSTVELSFTDSTQKFEWNQLHAPVLDETGAPCVSYNPDGKVVNKGSGIFWKHLGATDSSGRYFDFWGNVLGFDMTKIYPQEGFNVITTVYWDPVSNVRDFTAPFYKMVAGQNITEGLASIAALVPSSKDTQTAAGGWFNPLAGPVLNPTNGKNVTIEAATSKFVAADKFGYYLIEVNAKFLGKFVQKDQMKNNIRAIVGRFYNVNSYTSGSEGDSLIYTHSGSPMLLEAFKCRILDSDQNLAQNLGVDNTIFLQVVKNPKNTELGQAAEAEQAALQKK